MSVGWGQAQNAVIKDHSPHHTTLKCGRLQLRLEHSALKWLFTIQCVATQLLPDQLLMCYAVIQLQLLCRLLVLY